MKSPLPLLLILIVSGSMAQSKLTINGTVKARASGENLIGATVFNIPTGEGAISNQYGFYSVTLAADTVHLRVSYVGYESVQLKLLLSRDTTINFELNEGNELREVVVTANEQIQERSRMSTIDVPINQIKKMPAFLGETDVLKVLQLLPGVQSGTEGSSGLYVRGGGPDQNLILLDGVPVYNASHLFGFFSVFNADAINHVELIKGGFPARYGGRLSSVIDISMKEGNAKEFKGEGSIGLVASRITIEGPASKNTSFIVSGRRTYLDILARPLIKAATDGEETAGYYFYDLNGKINHRINDKNRIFLSLYSGDDKAYARSKYHDEGDTQSWSSESEAGLQWGNLTTALRWNSILGQKLFSNVTATYSRYRFAVSADSKDSNTQGDSTVTEYFHTTYGSGIRDYAIKVDMDYIPNPSHYIRFGGQATNHLFTPGVLSVKTTEIPDTTLGAQITHANEFFIYAEDDFAVTDRLKINAGLHASAFRVENKTYHSLQPRISGRYLLNANLSVKASYVKMTQFIHLLSNVGLGLPTDLWVPATSAIGPERSYLSSAGAAYNYNNAYEFSLETYYKKMKGLIEYKDGANYLNVESDWQTKVETGEGESYGAEFFAQKKTGRLNGWAGYTLSWTNRKFANINDGKKFPYKYDRRHDVEIALAYEWKKNKDLALTWVYGSGVAVTLPQSTYKDDGNSFYYGSGSVQFYDGRNSYRMRDYHRLDLSYTTTKKTKWGERSWTIAVYNVYSRRNPFFMDIGYDDKREEKRFIQYSLFPIIPSIAYRFKF